MPETQEERSREPKSPKQVPGNQETKYPKLTLIFTESELELIPEEIWSQREIQKYAAERKMAPSQLLLDSSHHHRAMKKLKDAQRRGRPDIIHQALLIAMDSWLGKTGLLRCYIHTWDELIIEVNPGARLPKSYHRFVALLEQLYEKDEIVTKQGEVLLKLHEKKLEHFLKKLKCHKLLLWEAGETKDPVNVLKKRQNENVVVMIGGFPHGDFKRAHLLADETLNLGTEQFSAPSSAIRMLLARELTLRGHL